MFLSKKGFRSDARDMDRQASRPAYDMAQTCVAFEGDA
jgi:hypothetical protein